jgi:hypothetical protein
VHEGVDSAEVDSWQGRAGEHDEGTEGDVFAFDHGVRGASVEIEDGDRCRCPAGSDQPKRGSICGRHDVIVPAESIAHLDAD